MNLKQIYILKNDSSLIKMVQEASVDKNSYAGYKMENGLLIGTKDWFDAIDNASCPKMG